MSEKRKFLKLKPGEQSNFAIIEFNRWNLWDGNISEMEVGDKMIIEVVEMSQKELNALPEFEGW